MTRETPESGVYTGEVQFYTETTAGSFDSNPSFSYFSDNVRSVSWSSDAGGSRRDGLGTPDAVAHDKSVPEEGEVEIVYDLQRQLVDGSGNVDDPAGDAFQRNSDNRVENTYHVRIRDDRTASDPDDPGSASGARLYIIAQGGHPNADMELDPADGRPVDVTWSAMCEKVREYTVYQPDSEGLTVQSSDTADTTQTLTIEDDSGTSEELTLNGTTGVSTTKVDWTSIRSLELDAETVGDVTVDTTTSGDTMATIRGSNSYSDGGNNVEGDLGIGAIGTGSLASAVGNSYEFFNGATVNEGGSAFSYDVNAASISCSNNYDAQVRHDTYRPRIDEGNRDITLQVDFIGWGISADRIDKALRTATENVTIGLASTDIEFTNAVVVGPDDVERGPDDSAIAYGTEFEPSDDNGISLSTP